MSARPGRTLVLMRAARVGFVLFCGLLAGGCVERSLTIETDPPGASVTLDGEPIGPSPVTVPFVHYGTRELLVVRGGYASTRRLVPVRAPWYQRFGIDLFAERAWPWKIHDIRRITIVLERQVADVDALVQRAREATDLSPSPDGSIR